MMFDSYKNSPAYDITGTYLVSAMQSDNSAIHNNNININNDDDDNNINNNNNIINNNINIYNDDDDEPSRTATT